MYRTQCVLALLALHIGLVYCFSWDIVLAEDRQLKFYYNGSITHTKYLKLSNNKIISSLAYDPVHNRVFFTIIDNYSWNNTIHSFNLLNQKTQTLVTINSTKPTRIIYDPVTQLLFWWQDSSIYSMLLKNASSNNTSAAGHFLVKSNKFLDDIAVDSCGGFIYWITREHIERIRYDGSEREILINEVVKSRPSLTIDPQTQKMYWIEIIEKLTNTQLFIETADLNGKNRKTLYSKEHNGWVCALVVSKDFIYWKSYEKQAILQLPKNLTYGMEPRRYTSEAAPPVNYLWNLQLIAANYTIEEQTQGTTSCKELKNLIYSHEPGRVCPPNCTDEEYYRLKCLNYCVQGNCSVSAEGQPICSCKAGYSGEKCEVHSCQKHCLNNGVCSMNKENEPVCECTSDYEGERCNITITNTGVDTCNTTQQEPQDLSNKVRQAVKEEIKRFLQFLSSKIDEYVGKI